MGYAPSVRHTNQQTEASLITSADEPKIGTGTRGALLLPELFLTVPSVCMPFLPDFLRKTAETMEGPLPPPKRPGPVYGNSPSTPLLSEPGEPVGSVHASAYAGPCERISAEARTSREETAAASAVGRVLPLGSMVAMAVLCNFDHGVIPAVLSDIQEHFDAIGYIEQSLLGSLVYVGVVSGTFLAGVSTNCMGAKWLLVASLLAASAASYGFSCARSLAVMYTARFFVGFCQVSPPLPPSTDRGVGRSLLLPASRDGHLEPLSWFLLVSTRFL